MQKVEGSSPFSRFLARRPAKPITLPAPTGGDAARTQVRTICTHPTGGVSESLDAD
jgi:hypothetical protein